MYLENTYETLILVKEEKVTDDAMPEGLRIHSDYLYSYLVFALSTQLWIAGVHNHLRTWCAQEYFFYSMKFTRCAGGMGSVSIRKLGDNSPKKKSQLSAEEGMALFQTLKFNYDSC